MARLNDTRALVAQGLRSEPWIGESTAEDHQCTMARPGRSCENRARDRTGSRGLGEAVKVAEGCEE